MVIVLQLILCTLVGLSGVCFGMEEQEEKIATWNILNVTHPDFYAPSHSKNMSGKLQIYAKENTDQLAAQFIPNNGPKIKLSNFHDISDHQKDIFFDNKVECPLYIPMHIYANNGCEEDIVVTKVEELSNAEDLLNITEFQVRVHADTIELYKEKKQSPIVLRHSDNIRTVQQALFSEKSFIVDFMENNRVTQGQVKNYSNGYRLQLSNFRSSFKWEDSLPLCNWDCIKMPVHLENNGKPQMISLDLDKEEKPQSYQLKKLMGVGLLVMILAALAYKLKDKFYTLGDLLLQQTKAITNMERLSITE